MASDREGFEKALARIRPKLVRLASRLVGDPDDAEDVVQDVCLSAARVVGKGKPINSLGSWLKTAVKYRSSRFSRDKGLHRERAPALNLGELVDEVIDDSGRIASATFDNDETTEGTFFCEYRGASDLYPGWRPSYRREFASSAFNNYTTPKIPVIQHTDGFLVLLQATRDLLLGNGVRPKYIRWWFMQVYEGMQLRDIAAREGVKHYQQIQNGIKVVVNTLEAHRGELDEYMDWRR